MVSSCKMPVTDTALSLFSISSPCFSYAGADFNTGCSLVSAWRYAIVSLSPTCEINPTNPEAASQKTTKTGRTFHFEHSKVAPTISPLVERFRRGREFLSLQHNNRYHRMVVLQLWDRTYNEHVR